MTYQVVLTDRAARDLDEAYRWYAERAPEAATRWYNGFLDALNSLGSNPERCPIAVETRKLSIEIRQLLYGRRIETGTQLVSARWDATTSCVPVPTLLPISDQSRFPPLSTRRYAVTSEASIRNKLQPQYVSFFEATLGMPPAEAQEAFESMIQRAKEESTRKQIGDWDANKLFEMAEANQGRVRAEFEWKHQEGVREEDFQWWWNMPDLERQMLIQADESNLLAYYTGLRKSGKSAEEALYEVRLSQPDFVEFFAWINRDGPPRPNDHMPLPVELKARVLNFQERQNSSEPTRTEWRKRRVEAGSANAAIRNEIKNGRL